MTEQQSPGVQGLAQLGRNAIDRVSELDRGIAYRDQIIRQLSEELDDLIKADNETIRSLFAEQAKRDETVRQLRTEAAKWERLHDELYAEIASEHRRDEYGETETAAECVRRVLRERDELRAAAPELVEALRTARDYVFSELETERQQMNGYERISRIDEIAADLAEIDAALAKAGVK